MRLPRAYDICISHCLAVRSFNVSLSGRYSFIRLIRIIVLRNYIYFLLRAVPFQYGTCHTIRKLIEYKANVNRESAAVFIVGFVTQQIEKLSVHYGYDKVKSIIGIRDYDKSSSIVLFFSMMSV